MRILLVRTRFKAPDYDAPLGLAILAAIAKQDNHNVQIADLNFEPLPDPSAFDVIGITGYSSQKKSVLELASHLQPYRDRCELITGGPWATAHPEEAFDTQLFDAVFAGEADRTFRQYLHEPSDDIYRDAPFKELDDLPFPAWNLVNLDRYVRVPIWSSRGCPYGCCFCSAHNYTSRNWRPRSPSSVVEELQYLSQLGVRNVTFVDDNPTFDPERFKQICQGIIGKGLRLRLDTTAGTRIDKLPVDLIQIMWKAGFRRVQLNPESACQRVIDEVIHKSLDLSCLLPTVKECLRVGMKVDVCFVIGFPEETRAEVMETVETARILRSLGCNCYVGEAMPMPDTEMYQDAKEKGYLRFDGAELENIIYTHNRLRQIHCLSSPYWEPEWIIKVHQQDCRDDARSTFRRYVFAREGWAKTLRDPRFVLRKVKAALG